MGLLIVNEGADGSGKKTQATLLCERLQREGCRVTSYSFPTYGADPVADLIRSMLREQKEEWTQRPWETNYALYAANRARFREQLRAHLAEPGSVVVCDRYVASGQAYVAALVDDEAEWRRRFDWGARLEYDLMGLPRPNVVLLHTMPSGVAQRLMDKRGKKDAHEENVPYLERVVRCFHLLAEREPDVWRRVAADVGGVVHTPATVHARVWETLEVHPAWQAFVRQRVTARS